MKNILSEKFSKTLLIIGLGLLAITIVMFLWKDYSYSFDNEIKADKFGQFGDFIGGVIGSIWALAGVVLFYVALVEQRKDFATNKEVLNAQVEALGMQIKEFELQRVELSQTREVFKIQSETFKLQQFESTFFNMLNLHQSIVNSIDIVSTKNIYEEEDNTFNIKTFLKLPKKLGVDKSISTGRDCFVKFRNGLYTLYTNDKDIKLKEQEESIEIDEGRFILDSYLKYYKKHQSDLGHYFRNLYHIVKFVHNSDISNKNQYLSLLRAQLSSDELFMLYYNCASENGSKSFKPLIEKYELLKNLDHSSLINMPSIDKFYKESAFGNRV